jgi:hypothetical protein
MLTDNRAKQMKSAEKVDAHACFETSQASIR